MAQDMPQRPKHHRREDSSSGTFTHSLPDTWSYEPKVHREYGIDGVIEIFDGDYATGLTFNVQLKGSDSAPASKAPIKTTTRNYWRSFAVPTLVVLVDSAEVIRYEWAHKLDTYRMKEGAATHAATFENVWGPESPSEIEREVRAARAAQNLRSHLPIHWSVDATPEVDGKWVSTFQLYLERRLNRFREFTRRQRDAGWAGIRISVQATRSRFDWKAFPVGSSISARIRWMLTTSTP
ncbi:DUF4365 domain-containing protein [Leifsonia xyli]|uniref:DUF4365 domain-containing protein n=1 Tax=Leifsonia xyli TaxID=1575 RepID=UPI003D66E02A